MDYKELLKTLLEMTGPPENMSQKTKDQDVILTNDILEKYSEEDIEAIMKKIGIDVRVFFIKMFEGKDPFSSDPISDLLRGSGHIQKIELNGPEDLLRVMKNIEEGRHPLDNGEPPESPIKGDPKDLTEEAMAEIWKKAGNGGPTH